MKVYAFDRVPDGFDVLATNLFTNPSFEGATSPGLTGGTISTDWASHGTKSLRVDSGETAEVTVAATSTVAVVAKDAGQTLLGNSGVEVQRNLFTNPNLIGDGTWAEVRRNLIANPSFEVNTSGWSIITGSTLTRVTTDFQSGAACGQIVGGPGVVTGAFVSAITTTPSTTYTASAWVRVPLGLSVRLDLIERYSSTEVGRTTSTVAATGAWQRVSVTRAFGATGTIARPSIQIPDLGANTLLLDSVQLEVGSIATPYFDGSSPQGSIDPDMRQRWLGTAKASESVMEIERVRGLIGINVIPGVSTRNGKPAVRSIPTGDTNSYFEVSPSALPATGTATIMGTRHLDAPLTGALDQNRAGRVLRVYPLAISSPQSPNTAGIHPVRHVFTTDGTRSLFGHGGTLGSGDVWWTDIGLFAGDYDGPAFTGDEEPSTDGFYAWAGTPNESKSIWYAANVDTSTEAGETLRVEATGKAAMLPGYWDQLTVVAGDYDGPVFDGDTAEDGEIFHDWVGAVNASESTRNLRKYLPVAPGTTPHTVIEVDDLDPGVESITVWRDDGGRWVEVSGAVEVPVAGSWSGVDWECGFNRVTAYRVEQFDSAGLSLGFLPAVSVMLSVAETWVQNVLAPRDGTPVMWTDSALRDIDRPTDSEVVFARGATYGTAVGSARRGIVGVNLEMVTDTLAQADKVQALLGSPGNELPPVLCVRKGAGEGFARVPHTMFVHTPSINEVDFTVRFGGESVIHQMMATEARRPAKKLGTPLLTLADLDAYYATLGAIDSDNLTLGDLDRRWDLAGFATI